MSSSDSKAGPRGGANPQGVAWVLVAEASQARIYSRQKKHSSLELVRQFAEPEARAREQDLYSDAPGRAFDSKGAGRHAMEPDHSGKDTLLASFTRTIAEYLEEGRQKHRFDRLVLVAAPRILGVLRQRFSSATQRLVVAEFAKNMGSREVDEIAALIDQRG